MGGNRTWTRLRLLLWMNWQVRRQRCCSMAMEFVMLVLVILVLAFLLWVADKREKEGLDKKGYDNLGFLKIKVKETHYPEINITQLVTNAFDQTSRPYFYAPNTGNAQKIMENVKLDTQNRTWMGFKNEDELMDKHIRLTANSNATDKLMFMAVIIDAPEDSTNWSYKIRIPGTRESGKVFKQSLYPPGNKVTGDGPPDGIRAVGPPYINEDNDNYVENRFIGMQILINYHMTVILTKDPDVFENVTISLQPMPYPSFFYYERRFYLGLLPAFLPWFIVLPYLVTFVVTLKMILEEKESGFKELLKINGVANWMHWVGWGMNTMLTYLIISIVLTILLASTGSIYKTPFPLFFILLLLFSLSFTTFIFFISSLFQKPTIGSWIGLLLLIGTMLTISYTTAGGISDMPDGKKWAYCVVPHGAIWVAAKIMTTYKSAPSDAEPNQSFHLGHATLMMILDAVVYMTLTLYFENILPSKFGVRKPFYYFITCCCWSRNKVKDMVGGVTDDKDGSFEPEPEEYETGVSIQRLTKVYGGKKAVDQVSLNIYKGQITVLLGHNGAGKTTLISMLTGMTRPSGGTASINNHDINTDLTGARDSLTVCPQENRLLGKLSVANHFKLFGQLKGLTAREAKEKSIELAKQMGLEEKLKVATEELSGGQMRKVQLGMAILGNAQVVFLDEPSSGIDPESRRHIWDLIGEFRKDRAIVLTTHHMEEADILGDRIAIMSNGKLKCCGSTVYLKKLYGQGYTLRLVVSEKDDPPDHSQTAAHDDVQESVSNIQDEGLSPDQSQPELHEKESEVGTEENEYNEPEHPKESIKVPSYSAREILNVLQNHVAGSKLVKYSRDVDKEELQLDFNVPVVTEDVDGANTDTSSRFPAMFDQLEKQKEDLAIISMGLAYTNMDDVFQKVAEDEQKLPENKKLDEDNDSNENSEQGSVANKQSRKKVETKGGRAGLFFRRLLALVLKRLLMMTKSKALLAGQVLISVGLFAGALVIIGESFEEAEETPFKPIPITLSAYNKPITKFTSSDPSLTQSFKAVVKSANVGEAEEFVGDLEQEYLNIGNKDINKYLNRLVVGAELSSTKLKGYASLAAYHSKPLAISLLTNAWLTKKAGPKYSISTVNHPIMSKYGKTAKALAIAKMYQFEKKSTNLFEYPEFLGNEDVGKIWKYAFLFAYLGYFGLAVLASSFVILPVEEKLSKAKQIQRIAGAGPVTYFFSFFICDMALLLIVSGLLISMVPVVNAFGYNLPHAHNNGLGVLYLILVVFGMNVIILSYLFSLRASSPSGGFIFLMLLHCVIVPLYFILLIVIVFLVAATGNVRAAVNILKGGTKFFLISPAYAVILCLQQFSLLSVANTACARLPRDTMRRVCMNKMPQIGGSGMPDELQTQFNMCCKFPQCLPNCFEPLSFFPAFSTRTIGFLLIILFLEALVFAALLLLIESGGCRVLKKLCKKGVQKMMGPPDFLAITDSDVKEEAKRVYLALASNNKRTDAFYASDFSKSYGNLRAVSNLSFGVHYGECFGLLGVNGAGKTTMFKMLTWDEIPSSGEALIEGMYSLSKHRKTFLSKIGFCPQFDAILPQLTGRQMLSLMCSIRGVYQKSVKDETQQWLVKMGLEKSGNVACGNYSGGTKRKLSAAMALIGNPPIVLLDEPSTGVDPQARRQFWKILSAVQNKGQAIILTSHSMDECEVLCNRLGVMVNGTMQCFGSVEHLKTKFAQGYTVTIALKHSAENARLIPIPAPGASAGTGSPQPPPFNQHPNASAGVSAPAPVYPPTQFVMPPPVPVVYVTQGNRRLMALMKFKFPQCELKDEHQGTFQIQIKDTRIALNTIFGIMERIKKEDPGLIEEYSVSDTTLEQIFLSFARMQYPERQKAPATCCKKCCKKCFSFCGLD